METKKNVIGLAKSSKTASKKTTPKKTTRKTVRTKKPTAIKLTPSEERDLKAKAKVDELLQGVDLDLNKKKDLIVLDETPKKNDRTLAWLEEQVALQAKEIETLRTELANTKANGGNVDENLKGTVIALFNELQDNHIKLGTNHQTGVGNFRIYTPGFLNRLIKFFPFLNEVKKY